MDCELILSEVMKHAIMSMLEVYMRQQNKFWKIISMTRTTHGENLKDKKTVKELTQLWAFTEAMNRITKANSMY